MTPPTTEIINFEIEIDHLFYLQLHLSSHLEYPSVVVHWTALQPHALPVHALFLNWSSFSLVSLNNSLSCAAVSDPETKYCSKETLAYHVLSHFDPMLLQYDYIHIYQPISIKYAVLPTALLHVQIQYMNLLKYHTLSLLICTRNTRRVLYMCYPESSS